MQLCLWWSIFCRTCLSVDCFQLHDWDVVGPRQLRFFNIPLWWDAHFFGGCLHLRGHHHHDHQDHQGHQNHQICLEQFQDHHHCRSSLPCLHLTISFVNAVRGRHKTVDRGQRTRSIEDVMKLHHHHHHHHHYSD